MVEKEINAGYPHFLPFPTMFQKALFLAVVERRLSNKEIKKLLEISSNSWIGAQASITIKTNIDSHIITPHIRRRRASI